jgi:hypothetical protein
MNRIIWTRLDLAFIASKNDYRFAVRNKLNHNKIFNDGYHDSNNDADNDSHYDTG